MVKWRVYYGDGITFDSGQGEPHEAPCVNVMHIVSRDTRPGHDPYNVGRYIVSGKDYYWWDEGGWWGGDIFGLWDYLARPGLKAVKFGRSIGTDKWREIYRRAHDDPDFPNKSANVPGEYNPAQLKGRDEGSVY